MDDQQRIVIAAKMQTRRMQTWSDTTETKPLSQKKQLLRNASLIAAVSFCLCGGAYVTLHRENPSVGVLSHLTAGFEYDETLGRLQFVSNILPESAMVFLNGDSSGNMKLSAPIAVPAVHAWRPEEPWIEYTHVGDVSACQDGEVMTIVRNHQNEFTVRLLHDHGYESVYSGMRAIQLKEHDRVEAGQTIGISAGFAAFELRKDGLSVQPVFSDAL